MIDDSIIKIQIRDGEEFIRLGQALKLSGAVGSGVEAKIVITEGEVSVNGETETRRGKKLHAGDEIRYDGQTIRVTDGNGMYDPGVP